MKGSKFASKEFYKGSKTPIQRGEQHPQARLTDKLVQKIRDDKVGRTYRALGKKYGISTSQAFRIVIREHWGHVK